MEYELILKRVKDSILVKIKGVKQDFLYLYVMHINEFTTTNIIKDKGRLKLTLTNGKIIHEIPEVLDVGDMVTLNGNPVDDFEETIEEFVMSITYRQSKTIKENEP